MLCIYLSDLMPEMTTQFDMAETGEIISRGQSSPDRRDSAEGMGSVRDEDERDYPSRREPENKSRPFQLIFLRP